MSRRGGGWEKQRTRAVASLEARTEVSSSRECDGPIYASSSRAHGSELWPPGEKASG